MRSKLNVVEIDRRPVGIRNESLRTRDESSHLERKLRKALDEKRKSWEQGFAAGIEAAAGLHEQLSLARGTRPDLEDTAPYPIIDPDLIVIE